MINMVYKTVSTKFINNLSRLLLLKFYLSKEL